MRTSFWVNVENLLDALANLAGHLFLFILSWSLLLVWTAWWLAGVNWPRMWDALRRGAWAPFVLLLLLAALVWSRIESVPGHFLGLPLANFWWQLGCVTLLAAYTLFLGWLQEVLHWTPREISLEPPAHAHDAHHGHDAHGHGTDHSSHEHQHAVEVTEPTHTHDVQQGGHPH